MFADISVNFYSTSYHTVQKVVVLLKVSYTRASFN